MTRRLLAAALTLLACSEDTFTPRWQVTRLRVVAVVADPPDAQPGEAVTLTAHTATPAGARAAARVLWATCPRLVIDNATGARRCDGTPTVLAGESVRAPLGEAPAAGAPWSFFGVACLGGDVTVDPATLQPRCAGGDGEVFLRTVRVRSGAANRNPRVARITLGDVTLAEAQPTRVPAGQGATLRVAFEADARDAYDEAQPDGTPRATREALLTQYLTDAGSFEGSFRSDEEGAPGAHTNRYTAPTSGGARLWVVVSDGRGGFDVEARAVTTGP